MLIRELIDHSVSEFADIKAVKWLEKKNVMERSYKELGENITLIRKGLKREGFSNKHLAFIGESSVYWIESFIGVITGSNVSVPLDFGLPNEDLIELINRSDSEGVFISLKKKSVIKAVLEKCPKVKKIWV
ncbi:MAG: AMP-binding protein, partial [Lachnospiraceae bacterium]|nr:AMP-binding protein [Lachnospiraceae bacterium]